MNLRYNEKGKFFTDRVTKDAMPAIIQTLTHRIEGNLFVRLDERFIDALNKCEQFIAVSNAVVFSSHGQQLYKSNFLVLNRDHVLWMIPKEGGDWL